MDIIRPFTVTTAALTSSVPETAPAAYNAGTTYAAADLVSVTTGLVSLVYKSLQASNTGHTPASSPIWWQYVATTYTAYNAGTTYAQGDIAIDTTTHRKYESLQAGNTGHSLTEDGSVWWLDIGPTNRWAMFDAINGTQTQAEAEIVAEVAVTGRVNSVALLNIAGTSVNIVAEVAGPVEVYNETYSLTDNSGITDWYAYFFEEITSKSDFAVTDLPVYADMTITITLTGTGTVKIGSCVIGQSKTLGATVYGARIGITDYSRKTIDDFGNYVVTERAFSKRGTFNVVVAGESMADTAAKVDAIQQLLAGYRATPVVWVGAEDYSSTIIFGFFRSFEQEIAYPSRTNLSLEIEGLT